MKNLSAAFLTIIALLLSFSSPALANEGGVNYYDLTQKSRKVPNYFYAGVGVQMVNIDYNSDDPDNRGTQDFQNKFSGPNFMLGALLQSGTAIEFNNFRQKDEAKSHTVKIHGLDFLIPIARNRVERLFLDFGASYVKSSIKTSGFYQRALGFNVGLAYEFPVYEDIYLRLATKAIIVDKSDDIGIDNIYMQNAAVIFHF